jgi:putative oxidoreductase
MNRLLNLERWGDAHHPQWLDILRIFFGLFLCFKGIQLLNNIDDLQQLMTNKLSFSSYGLVVLSHYIVFAHVIGGFFLAIGFLTRLASLIQIPILFGAIIFINSSGHVFRPFSELFLSIIVLLLLVCFLVVGSGPWSVNRFIDQENRMHVNT